MKNKNQPLHILKGKNHYRYLVVFLMLTIIGWSVYAFSQTGPIILFLVFLAILGLILVRFPYLYVYQDHLEIHKNSILKLLSESDSIFYRDIKEVKYVEGYTNRSLLILKMILGIAAQGGFSKPDRILFRLHTNVLKFIFRFGSKEDFKKIAHVLHNLTTS